LGGTDNFRLGQLGRRRIHHGLTCALTIRVYALIQPPTFRTAVFQCSITACKGACLNF
jgi:hypothetical protein